MMSLATGKMELFANHFATKISTLKQYIELQGSLTRPDTQKILSSVQQELIEIDSLLSQLKTELQERRKTLKTVETMRVQIQSFEERLKLDSANMPVYLPNRTLKNDARKETAKKSSTPMYRNWKGRVLDSPGSRDADETPAPSYYDIRKMSSTLFVPQMEYLTVEEFDQVPSYIKVRVQYQQVNGAVDELNKAMKAKYILIKTDKTKLTDNIRKAIREYKDQEVKDTKGSYFIVDKDIVSLSKMKLDKAGRTILTVLRHCGRTREVRGNNLTRYLVNTTA